MLQIFWVERAPDRLRHRKRKINFKTADSTYKLGATFLVQFFLAILCIAVLILSPVSSKVALAKYNLTILHTNDLHSHLDALPRLSAAVEEIKKAKAAQNEPVLLLDSGDFIIGTLYHLLTTTYSPELTLMSSIGYDATTLGNHEFDWGPDNLANIINIAIENKDGEIVPIVASNMEFSFFHAGDDELKKLYDAGIIRPYIIKTLTNGLKVGIIGLLGRKAAQEAMGKYPLRFIHNRDFIQQVVGKLKNKGVDLVICLSHSGFEEDKKLARLIEGIDIIVGGHCHSVLFEPVQVGSTFILQAGSYGNYLGKLEVSIKEKKTYVRNYQLLAIDSIVSEDKAMKKVVRNYRDIIDKEILAPLGLSFNETLAKADFDLVKESEYITGTNLGDLVTDALRFAIDAIQPEDFVNFTFYPAGFLRGNIDAGEITTSDVFRVVSLGTGPEEIGGYPLVSFYLTPREIKNALELSIFLALTRGTEYLLHVSGMRFWYNPLRPNFRKITRIEKLLPGKEEYILLDTSDTRSLYKVGANLFLLNISSYIKKYLPALAITPKDKDGNAIFLPGIENKSHIFAGTEWQALINYISHFPDLDEDLIPDVPLSYAKAKERINLDSDDILTYYNKRKSPLIGVGAALIFPSLGHAYSNNWYPNGFVFLLMQLASALLASGESTREAGIFLLASFKLMECKDAYDSALEYNRRLDRALEVISASNSAKAGFAFTYRF